MFTKKNAEKEITIFKEEYQKNIENTLINQGYLEPIITVFVYDTKKKIYIPTTITVPLELIESEKGKNIFALLAPHILKTIADNNMVPLCYTYSSEAWIRKAKKEENEDDVPKNWKSLPKEECLMTYFETVDEMSLKLNVITRDGKRVNEEGELIDNITLTLDETPGNETPELKGRFTDIFKKYQKLLDE